MTAAPDDVQAAVDRTNARFRSHGGSVRLLSVRDGVVSLGFAGLCAGCTCRAVCLEHTARPLLTAVEGVRAVEAPGARLSDEAAVRLRGFLGADGGSA